MRRTLSGDIDPDDLLSIASRAVRESDAEFRGEQEPPRVEIKNCFSLREDRLAAAYQRRKDLAEGVDRAADAEAVLLDHLRVKYGPQEGDIDHLERPDHEYRRLYFPDYVNP